MTEQEAIKSLKEKYPLELCDEEEYEMAQIAIQAIEKQIPEKPDEMMGLFGDIEYNCRACGEIIEKNYYAYCPTCGQKLDWGGGSRC